VYLNLITRRCPGVPSTGTSSRKTVARVLATASKHELWASVRLRWSSDSANPSNLSTRRLTQPLPTSQSSKEELILSSADGPDRFVYPLELESLTAAVEDSGDVVYRDGDGTERARTPHGFMYDSNLDPNSGEPVISNVVSFAIIPHGGGQALEAAPRWPSKPPLDTSSPVTYRNGHIGWNLFKRYSGVAIFTWPWHRVAGRCFGRINARGWFLASYEAPPRFK